MLHLASRSPRRSELLARLRLRFGVLDLDVPEVRAEGEPPEDYVRRVAREKAGAGLLRLAGQGDAWVLAADTEVVVDDVVFGKPADREDAARMLAALAGRSHAVISAVWLVSPSRELHAVSRSTVTFGELSPAIRDWYLDTGEWQGKAGAYGIQGAAQVFITHLDGSHSGVMGLPLAETSGLLAQAGIWP